LFKIDLLKFRGEPFFSSFNFYFQAVFHCYPLFGIGSYFVLHVGDGGHLIRKNEVTCPNNGSQTSESFWMRNKYSR
jgi:hypothetical protein